MTIEDFELEIVKAKPGDTIIIKFPIDKYEADFLLNSFHTLKEVVPEGVELVMMPSDWVVEV